MTSLEKQQVVAALQHSLRYIWDGKHKARNSHTKYICVALSCAKDRHPHLYSGMIRAQGIISQRLGKWPTVESYLGKVLKIPENQRRPQAVQEFRILWVKELIREFSQ